MKDCMEKRGERGDFMRQDGQEDTLRATDLALPQGTQAGDNRYEESLETYLFSKLEQGSFVSPWHRGTAATLQPHHPRVFPLRTPQSDGGPELRGPQTADRNIHST